MVNITDGWDPTPRDFPKILEPNYLPPGMPSLPEGHIVNQASTIERSALGATVTDLGKVVTATQRQP